MSLNDPAYVELDLSNRQEFNYYGNSDFMVVIDKLKLSEGEFWVPLIEVDFPLDSLFYFMM